jgi:hypothetical protein
MSLSPACTCVSCPCHGESLAAGSGPDGAAGPFSRSRGFFGETVSWLAGPAMGLEHGALEGELAVRGRELSRQMLQDCLDARAAGERRLLVVAGADGVTRTRAERGHSRPLASVFGEVTVTRIAYRAPGAANLHLADAALNLPAEKHSHGVRRLAAIESARGSFEAAGQAAGRVTGTVLGKRQAEELARAAAADVDGFYASRRPGPSGRDVLLVMQFDGKGIVMRPGALREATARAAAAASRKLVTRLWPGEKNGRKRMAELAAVYDAAPAPRTAADIIRRPGAAGRGKPAPGPEATGKWLAAPSRLRRGESRTRSARQRHLQSAPYVAIIPLLLHRSGSAPLGLMTASLPAPQHQRTPLGIALSASTTPSPATSSEKRVA